MRIMLDKTVVTQDRNAININNLIQSLPNFIFINTFLSLSHEICK